MLPKNKRATTKQVSEAIKNGTAHHSENFSVRSLKNPLPTVVAVVVSKKVSKKAVIRNKLKRRTRDILRSINLPKNKILIFYIKKNIFNLAIADTKKELKDLIS